MKMHSGQHIHMIGIGGAGMSPIAELLVNLGYRVTGSDRTRSDASVRLESIGVAVQYHHTPELMVNADLVAYSSAIREDNPEREYAETNALRQIRRAELLGDLMRAQTTVCICGTHGKTTTTSLAGIILHEAGLKPTVLVGGMFRDKGTHAIIGHGTVMVAEADEFDRSFLAMFPTVAIITNIDADHLDCYRDLAEIKEAFVAFTRRVPFYGTVIACTDDAGVRDILPRVAAKVVTYGTDGTPEVTARDIRYEKGCAIFTALAHGKELGEVRLTIPGIHNVRNALATIALAELFEVDKQMIINALASFGGVRRRFEVRAIVDSITIVDDYAHHPREIQATLDAAARFGAKRVVAVFQPHLFTRTRDFMDEFAGVLTRADAVYVTAIYKSREEPIPGITAAAIVDTMNYSGYAGARYIADRQELIGTLCRDLQPGDLVVLMGAGDIGDAADVLREVLDDKT